MSPSTTYRSVRQTPQAATFMRSWPLWGSGSGRSIARKGEPGASSSSPSSSELPSRDWLRTAVAKPVALPDGEPIYEPSVGMNTCGGQPTFLPEIALSSLDPDFKGAAAREPAECHPFNDP
jgi:hypothetical protein